MVVGGGVGEAREGGLEGGLQGWEIYGASAAPCLGEQE